MPSFKNEEVFEDLLDKNALPEGIYPYAIHS